MVLLRQLLRPCLASPLLLLSPPRFQPGGRRGALLERRQSPLPPPPAPDPVVMVRLSGMMTSSGNNVDASPTLLAEGQDSSPTSGGHASSKNLPRELSFVSRLNCTTGKVEWVELPEDYDFHQEIARSAYADMLHDHDRNIRYFQALRYEIGKLKASGQEANVLDIGTGTGLLSMMAVVAGADNVFACDAFSPMLECAKKVIKRNGFESQIKLIAKRSTELKVGVDIPYRCNILVTEVFDTELIGEGAIGTFNHAHKELLTDPAVVIPGSSTVYAQVVCSPEVEKWNSLPSSLNLCASSSSPPVVVQFPPDVSSCPGIPSVQDLQLDAIQTGEFTPLSAPVPILTFDFTSPDRIPTHRGGKLNFKSESTARANAVFLWWDLDMDTSGENVLSCQPSYVKSGPSSWFQNCPPQSAAWRDHWMHSVYFIPRSAPLDSGDNSTLHFAHDEYAFWFDVAKSEDTLDLAKFHPVCECGVHNVISRSQIYMMNDVGRYESFIRVYRNLIVPGETVCMCLSDCSILPLILIRLGAAKVFVVETCPENERVFKRILKSNCVDGIERIEFVGPEPHKLDVDKMNGLKIDLITGDPHFHVAVYPWNNLMFWYLLKSLNPGVVSPTLKLAPFAGVLRGVAVHFTHLWKIHAPVGKAADQFDLTDFDELIRDSSAVSDSAVDAQPLWEYECRATSEPVDLMEFSLSENPELLSGKGELRLRDDDDDNVRTNGIAIWIDWKLDEKTIISTGPKEVIKPGEKVVWQRFSKQGVYFIEDDDKPHDGTIKYSVGFDQHTGDITFTFK